MTEAELEELLRDGLRRHAAGRVPTDPGTAAEELVLRIADRRGRAGRRHLSRWGLVAAPLVAAACALAAVIASSGSRPAPTAAAAKPASSYHSSSHSPASSSLRAQAPQVPAPEFGVSTGRVSTGGVSTGGVSTGGAATGAPSAAPLTLTASDGGRAFTLRRGQAVRVELSGASLTWGAPRAGGSGVLSTISSGSDAATGEADALFVAAAWGRTTVSATARPRCPAGTPCPQFVRYWTVSVTVSG